MALAEIAAEARETADIEDVTLSADGGATLSADPGRLRSLFAAAYRFAAHNGASTVTVGPTAEGFTVSDDGAPLGDNSPESYFEYGSAIPDAEAGLDLPNVRMLAETHGWDATLDTAYEDGIRVVVTGVTTLETGTETPAVNRR